MPVPFLLPLMLLGAPSPEPAPPVADQTSAGALREKLRTGPGPVRVVVLGDSLTAGWGPDNPRTDGFCQLFAQALRARYPGCEIEVIAAGGPGQTSDDALTRVDRDVVSRRPDVVVLQFGGNDERLGRSPQDLTDDLTRLIQIATSPPVNALCLVATPPMNDAQPNSRFVRAARFAAEGEGVPIANFDDAVRRADRDFRGPFCWGAHPGAYTHLVMARELLRAWERLLELKQGLAVAIEGGVAMLTDEALPPIRVTARNVGVTSAEVELQCGADLLLERAGFRLEPEQEAETSPRIALPQMLPPPRTKVVRLWATGRAISPDAGDLDVKWLALAPVVVPDTTDPTTPDRLTWHRLGADALVLGEDEWKGDDDLSARFALELQDERLTVFVDVTDDDISPAPRNAHFSDGDSVEVYFDLRSSADQGKPVYSPDVVALLIKPPDTRLGTGTVTWAPLDKPTARLGGISASGERMRSGYRVRLVLPASVLVREGEKDFTGVGFDVGVNDADRGGPRDCQMMWAGTAQDYLNPSAFAALAAPSPTPPRWRMSVR